MGDTYSIKYSKGTASFEITGSDKDWVEAQVKDFRAYMEQGFTQPFSSTSSGEATAAIRKIPSKTAGKRPVAINATLAAAWNDEVSQKMLDFVAARQKAFDRGTARQAAILATFLKDEMGIGAINSGDLEFVYRKLGWPTINHVAQLANAASRDRYFASNNGKYELIHPGLVFGRDTAKD